LQFRALFAVGFESDIHMHDCSDGYKRYQKEFDSQFGCELLGHSCSEDVIQREVIEKIETRDDEDSQPNALKVSIEWTDMQIDLLLRLFVAQKNP